MFTVISVALWVSGAFVPSYISAPSYSNMRNGGQKGRRSPVQLSEGCQKVVQQVSNWRRGAQHFYYSRSKKNLKKRAPPPPKIKLVYCSYFIYLHFILCRVIYVVIIYFRNNSMVQKFTIIYRLELAPLLIRCFCAGHNLFVIAFQFLSPLILSPSIFFLFYLFSFYLLVTSIRCLSLFCYYPTFPGVTAAAVFLILLHLFLAVAFVLYSLSSKHSSTYHFFPKFPFSGGFSCPQSHSHILGSVWK